MPRFRLDVPLNTMIHARTIVLLPLAFLVGWQSPQEHDVGKDETCAVEGYVVDTLNAGPVANAQVDAISRDNYKTNTDAKGHYVLKGLKPGRYAVYARKDGYGLKVRLVNLMHGMNLDHFNLQLPKGATISGHVLNADGKSLANMRVDVWAKVFRDGSNSFFPAGFATTDETGRYRISGLTKGTYYVGVRYNSFHISGFRPRDSNQKQAQEYAFRRVFYSGAYSLDSATPVHVDYSEQHENVDFFVEKTATFCVTGLTSFPDTPKESTVSLLLSEFSGGWKHILRDGEVQLGERFEICGLSPGESYILFASIWQNDRDVGALARMDFSGTQRDLDLGFLDVGVLSLQTGKSVRGYVSLDTSEPGRKIPEGIRLSADPVYRYNIQNESRVIDVEPSGSFLFASVLPDEHRFQVLGLPPGYYTKKASLRGQDLLRDSWRPDRGEMEIVLSSDGSAVSGRVVDKDHKPVRDAQVILATNDSSRVIVKQADQDGQFQFASGLPPGDYRIVAVAGLVGGEAENPDIANKYLSKAIEVSLSPRGHQIVTLTAVDEN